MNNLRKKFAREIDVSNVISKHKYQCKHCGRKEVIRFDQDKKICTHCGNYIFKNEKEEFKFKMERLMK